MNAKKIFGFLSGILIYLVIAFMLTAYGNKKTHPDINTKIVDRFLSRYDNKYNTIPKFNNYSFINISRARLSGTGITKDGLFHPQDVTGVGYGYFDEGTLKFTPQEWISHGGYSADVPEVPASLRHFYDPTKAAGSRYLTDKANSKLMGYMQSLFTNPKVDGVEWAVGVPNGPMGVQEHYYTWENGKMWMKMALEEEKVDKRNELMARVWRSLGETLHMIADNGCPSHVRNDAHPSPLWSNNSLFGNPDPYEEYVDIIRNSELTTFNRFFDGAPDPDLKQDLASMTQIRSISHALASFTNVNFLTGETISGTNRFGNPVSQIINKTTPYSSPLLHQMDYKNDYYVSKVGAYEIKHCTDVSYFLKLVPRLIYPLKVDVECVKTQASALFPNIVEAGVQAMKIYIPEIKVEILEIKDGLLSGVVKHKTDKEYTQEIEYNGPVLIEVINPKLKVENKYEAEAKDGEFEVEEVKFTEKDSVYAEIDFGGIKVRSNGFNGEALDLSQVKSIHFAYCVFHDQPFVEYGIKYHNDFNTNWAGFTVNGKFNGNYFSGNRQFTAESGDLINISLNMEVAPKTYELEKLQYSYNVKYFDVGSGQTILSVGSGIPVSFDFGHYATVGVYSVEGLDVCKYMSSFHNTWESSYGKGDKSTLICDEGFEYMSGYNTFISVRLQNKAVDDANGLFKE